MSITTIILIIVGLCALGIVFDSVSSGRFRRKEEGGEETASSNEPLTANEAMPTQTGRFRAREALARVERERQKSGEDGGLSDDDSDDGEIPLPDPFNKNNS